MASASNPPLYLHITSTTKEGLEKAIDKVNELLHSELPALVDERRFRRREREEQPTGERDEFGRRKWPDKQIPVNLDPIPGFNLRAQVVGHGGAYVKHIQQETGCRVQIKGRGSGFIESSTGRESDEPMYLHVTAPDPDMVEKAKDLCEDLLANVKDQYESFKSRPQRPYGGQGSYVDRHGNGSQYSHYQSYSGSREGYNGRGGRGGYNGYGGHGTYGRQDRDRNEQSGYNSPNSATGNSSSVVPGHANRNPAPNAAPVVPTAPPSTNTETALPTGSADYAAQYAQYYGSNDPYAPYGGYAAYVQYYQQYYAAAQQAQQQQQAAPSTPPGVGQTSTTSSPPPPPPPPGDAPPLPPPPPNSDGVSPVSKCASEICP
ncbi:KH domain containing protein [Sporothrix schenckii 1099-18]|uniref:KH domain containing protein n=1 Tax=Sporothrix schenckii 1099-18 TaxID=1397361 RepID=A0A0F2M2G4_SPOSC|nr:KH domain containing protein [Sporothrix schenckii 1099-18]KJR83902.1 KH domain containing protein [Sporothrix schenckii 1099-18]